MHPTPNQNESIPVTSGDDHQMSRPDMQMALKDLAALSSLQPEKIAEVLRANPELRDVVWAAVDKQKKGGNS